MAYLRLIGAHTCNTPGCQRTATHELVNTYNATIGRYCPRHGERALSEQRAAEAETMARLGHIPRPNGTND